MKNANNIKKCPQKTMKFANICRVGTTDENARLLNTAVYGFM